MTTKTRIHLADNPQVLFEGMMTLLRAVSNFEIAGFSLNPNHLFEEVAQNKNDILVLDVNMPEDGTEIISELTEKGFSCKVIIMSNFDDLKLIKELMKLGVSSYLTKQSPENTILEGINAVSDDQEYFYETIREKIAKYFTKDISNVGKYEPIANSILTNRELEIIKLISLEYSGREIGDRLFISTNTVETHRKNIMKKLEAKNTISLVKYAIKNNLIEA